MVIVKSKIDFATSMRRIFQKYGRKNFRFSVQKTEKSGEKFSLQSVYLFLSQKGRRLRKKDGLENKGKFFQFSGNGPSRPPLDIRCFLSKLFAGALYPGQFYFCSEIIAKEPLDLHFSSLSDVVAPARMLYWAPLRGMPLTEKQFMRAGCPMKIRPSKASYHNGLIKILPILITALFDCFHKVRAIQ